MSFYKSNWIPQENYYYAVENTNFEPNPERRDGSLENMLELMIKWKIYTITCRL